jgi:NADH-ubiquinone oxidoreductase chain 5
VTFIEISLFTYTGGVDVSILLLIDYISLFFIGVVIFISSIVLIYRTDYIHEDKNFYRFTILVCLFIVSMILIVLRPNMVRILLGWDGLGLVSYCLIIFYQNDKSASSGILTVLSNRVGDIAILLTIR